MTDLETQKRLNRLNTEAIYLGRKYGVVNYDRTDGTWLHIAKFPLGPGWNKSFVELLLDVPHASPGYPQIAPTWFWTDRDLATKDGRSIKHFFISGSSHADNIHLDKGWGHYCVHVRYWHPSSGFAITQGDSFLTYVELIRVVLHDKRTFSA